jgi:serine protease inhibitor
MTSMVLVNAIYFKGLWEEPFEKKATTKRDFFTGETKKIKVPFMTQTDKMQYAKLEDFDAQLLQLFYKVNFFCPSLIHPNNCFYFDIGSKVQSGDFGARQKNWSGTSGGEARDF